MVELLLKDPMREYLFNNLQKIILEYNYSRHVLFSWKIVMFIQNCKIHGLILFINFGLSSIFLNPIDDYNGTFKLICADLTSVALLIILWAVCR